MDVVGLGKTMKPAGISMFTTPAAEFRICLYMGAGDFKDGSSLPVILGVGSSDGGLWVASHRTPAQPADRAQTRRASL